MNREGQEMGRNLHAVAAAGTLLITIAGAEPALAQKSGGVLKIYHRDSPASMSILEALASAERADGAQGRDLSRIEPGGQYRFGLIRATGRLRRYR
jgi:hypothetical protein